ncbi:MAG: GNAT family N-acetyltransferase [Actinomycetota bacterium]
MALEIRTVGEAEAERYTRAITRAFGDDPQDGEDDRLRQVLGLDRTHAAFDGDEVVGTIGSYRMSMPVPGGADLPTAGLTRVSVAATHRRQGILTELIGTHFDHAIGAGEPVSILWASEIPIYSRFGYGQATTIVQATLDARVAGLERPATPDRLSIMEAEAAAELLPGIHEEARRRHPGRFARNDAWWEHRVLPDHEWMREGQSTRRYVVAHRDDRPVGYVLYRQKSHWTDNDLPEGTTHVVEFAAVDDLAEHTLWFYLSSIDLFPHVKAWTIPPDTILPWLAGNARAIGLAHSDGIHLRVLDPEAALSARRYDRAGRVVFEVMDRSARAAPDDRPFRTSIAGTYALDVADDGTASCARTEDEPTVRVSTLGLGAAYLGEVATAGLRQAGHLVGDDDAVGTFSRTFSWPVAPWCPEGF